MSSIVTAVFKATIGLLVNKGRDKAAEILKDGDVTDQRFRGLIVREIDDIKSKLDGLARKDLLASISFFKEGIELLYEVLNKTRSRSEYGTATTQGAAGIAGAEAVSLAKGMKKMDLTDLDESGVRVLSNAKKRFEDARRKATEAFNNEALELSDRVLAMQCRVMATILETVDNPEDALAACGVCIEELHSLSAVKDCFTVEVKKGFWARFSKDERRALISSTCHVNRVIYDVMSLVCFGNNQLSGNNWPCIDTGKEKIDPLRDDRVATVLQKQGMKECSVRPWSFGQEGKREHELKKPRGMATSKDGQFVIADNGDKTVKVFDSSGHFILKISPNADDGETKLVCVWDVATDEEGNIYALVALKETESEGEVIDWTGHVLVFNSADGKQLRKFPVKRSGDWNWFWDWDRTLMVSRNKVLVTWRRRVDAFELDGGYIRSIGEEELKGVADITAGPDGRVLVLDRGDSCIHVFTEDGQQLNTFSVQTEEAHYGRVAYHPGGEHVIVAGYERGIDRPSVAVYTKDGECQRTVKLHQRVSVIGGITVSMEGRICVTDYHEGKVIML